MKPLMTSLCTIWLRIKSHIGKGPRISFSDKIAEFIASKDTTSCLPPVHINQAQLSWQAGHQGLLHSNVYSRLPATQFRHTKPCLAYKSGISAPFQVKLLSCKKRGKPFISPPKGSLRTSIAIHITDHWIYDGNSMKGSSHPEGPGRTICSGITKCQCCTGLCCNTRRKLSLIMLSQKLVKMSSTVFSL